MSDFSQQKRRIPEILLYGIETALRHRPVFQAELLEELIGLDHVCLFASQHHMHVFQELEVNGEKYVGFPSVDQIRVEVLLVCAALSLP